MSDKMNNAGVKPQAPKVQPTVEAKKSTGSAKSEAFKNSGAVIRQQMTPEQKEAEGSKSDKIAFVACLGNPARSQSRKVEGRYDPSYQVVGYKFRALEDVNVPVAPFKEGCKDILEVVKSDATRPVKAGEEFDLNVMETAFLICRPEYAGSFNGEGRGVFISPTISATRQDPAPCMKATEGSIKENMILVAEMVDQTPDGKGGRAIVKPEYEAFAELFKARSTRRSGGASAASKAKGESVKNTAAAFRELFGMKA